MSDQPIDGRLAALRERIVAERDASREASRDPRRSDWRRDQAAAHGWAFSFVIDLIDQTRQ